MPADGTEYTRSIGFRSKHDLHIDASMPQGCGILRQHVCFLSFGPAHGRLCRISCLIWNAFLATIIFQRPRRHLHAQEALLCSEYGSSGRKTHRFPRMKGVVHVVGDCFQNSKIKNNVSYVSLLGHARFIPLPFACPQLHRITHSSRSKVESKQSTGGLFATGC